MAHACDLAFTLRSQHDPVVDEALHNSSVFKDVLACVLAKRVSLVSESTSSNSNATSTNANMNTQNAATNASAALDATWLTAACGLLAVELSNAATLNAFMSDTLHTSALQTALATLALLVAGSRTDLGPHHAHFLSLLRSLLNSANVTAHAGLLHVVGSTVVIDILSFVLLPSRLPVELQAPLPSADVLVSLTQACSVIRLLASQNRSMCDAFATTPIVEELLEAVDWSTLDRIVRAESRELREGAAVLRRAAAAALQALAHSDANRKKLDEFRRRKMARP
jgi:hypothetical protein